MSNQTGWYLMDSALASYPLDGERTPVVIQLRTHRWGANQALSDIIEALRQPAKRNTHTIYSVAEWLIHERGAEFGITNTDAPIVVVNFQGPVVELWSDYEKKYLRTHNFKDFATIPTLLEELNEKYFSN
jgi:hypothetical protein